MEGVRLFILKIILCSIILHAVLAASSKDAKQNNPQSTITAETLEHAIKMEKTSPSKLMAARTARNAYRRNWSKSHHGGGYSNMPPYLVLNRKTGSYYPYYTYPKENNIRRSGNKSFKKWTY